MIRAIGVAEFKVVLWWRIIVAVRRSIRHVLRAWSLDMSHSALLLPSICLIGIDVNTSGHRCTATPLFRTWRWGIRCCHYSLSTWRFGYVAITSKDFLSRDIGAAVKKAVVIKNRLEVFGYLKPVNERTKLNTGAKDIAYLTHSIVTFNQRMNSFYG